MKVLIITNTNNEIIAVTADPSLVESLIRERFPNSVVEVTGENQFFASHDGGIEAYSVTEHQVKDGKLPKDCQVLDRHGI